MTYIIIGFVGVYAMNEMNMSESYIIANAILIAAWGIVDKLWDVKIGLTEIKNTMKR